MSSPSCPHWQRWFALFLLLAVFAQTTLAATRTSLTIDEGLHITSGYSILRTGDYRLIEEHPPLIKELAALPLLLIPDLPDPRTLPAWDAPDAPSDTIHLVRVMKQWLQPYRPFDRVVYAARVPIALLAVLLGALVFRWASDLAGTWAGLIALGLCAFDPNLLAHGSVAAIDLGAAACVAFASYTFWRTFKRTTRFNVILAGLTLGLALAAKISTAILLPAFVVLIGLRTPRANRSHVICWGVRLAIIFALAGVTLWAVYGFEVKTPPGWAISIPAASHLIPLERVRSDVAEGRTTFLMGQYSQHGWWYYFPVAFAIKTPVPTLILLAASVLGLAVRTVKSRMAISWDTLNLIVFPVIYLAIAISQPFNIGYRHLLPILPFVFVFTGAQIVYRISRITYRAPVTLSPDPAKLGRHLVTLSPYLLVSALFAWYIVGTMRIFPDYLAYFNELVGGPDNGGKWLVDSNLDWGQAWKDLKAYMDTHGITRIKFAQFSSNDPAVYGIDYEPIAPMTGAPPVLPSRFSPAPGVYVLSASSLQGVPLADINTYDYFRHRQPTARIGHALFLYDIKPIEPRPGWVSLCVAPTPPLDPADIEAGFGRSDLRLVYFDCQQTWVLPGNAVNGWGVLPYELAHDKNSFPLRWLRPDQLVFEQKQSFALPPHSIFQVSTEGKPKIARPVPATFGQTAELLGYTLDRATVRRGQSVELLTLWRVIGPPPGSLSIMAHLWNAEGQPIAVGDGLGFTADQWQIDDVFVQRNVLQIPANAPAGAFEVRVGLYTLDTIQRLPVFQNGAAVGDSLRLAQLSIRP